jgi:carbon-monoxide dehydrogenase small subunit
VTVDGVLQCACLMLGVEANGFHVETIEGMAKGADLHPLQKAFLLHNGLQCGICTPDLPWLCAGLNHPFMPLPFRTAWL